jgi:hypothetical protein
MDLPLPPVGATRRPDSPGTTHSSDRRKLAPLKRKLQAKSALKTDELFDPLPDTIFNPIFIK